MIEKHNHLSKHFDKNKLALDQKGRDFDREREKNKELTTQLVTVNEVMDDMKNELEMFRKK